MATKQYIDLSDLALFKQLNDSATAQAIATAEARSLHTVAIDGTTLKFYREEEPVGSATPAYSVNLPQQDLSNYLQKIASATGSKIVVSNSDGTISESDKGISDFALASSLATVATSGAAADVSIADTGSHFTATTVEGALAELASATGGGVAEKTVYITETAGGSGDAYSKRYGIYQGANGTVSVPVPAEKLVDIDIPKDMVVEDGEVVDVVFKSSDNTLHEGSESGTDVTTEIMGSVTPTAANAGKYIKLTIANASSSHLWIPAKDLVDIYTSGSDASTDELIITISNDNKITASVGSVGIASTKVNYAIPDVYTVDSTVTADNFDTKIASGIYTKSGNTYTQVESGDTFDSEETYYTKTAAHNETVQSALTRLDAAIGGGGSVDAKIAEAIAGLDSTKSQTAGADGLALSITETDGKIASISGSIAANTYEAYGAVSTAIGGLDAVADATKTAIDGSTDRTKTDAKGVFALQALTETDGKFSAMTAVEVAQIGSSNDTASDNTIYGVKAYVDAHGGDETEAVPEADIRALFSSPSV